MGKDRLPRWLQALQRWCSLAPQQASGDEADIPMPEEKEAELAALMSTMLGIPAVIRGAKPGASKAPRSITLMLVPVPGPANRTFVLSEQRPLSAPC